MCEADSDLGRSQWLEWQHEGQLDWALEGIASHDGVTALLADLNRNSGFRSVTEGAEASVYLATLPADGPSGILWGHLWTADGPADAYGVLPW